MSTRPVAVKKLWKSFEKVGWKGARLHLSSGFKIALKSPMICQGKEVEEMSARDAQKDLLRYILQGAWTVVM